MLQTKILDLVYFRFDWIVDSGKIVYDFSDTAIHSKLDTVSSGSVRDSDAIIAHNGNNGACICIRYPRMAQLACSPHELLINVEPTSLHQSDLKSQTWLQHHRLCRLPYLVHYGPVRFALG